MYSNFCLIIIIGLAIVTMLTGGLSRNINKEIHERILRDNDTFRKEALASEEELAQRRKKLEEEALKRLELHTKARTVAVGILETNRELSRLERQQDWFQRKNTFVENRTRILDARTGEIRDNLQEETANVERTKQEVENTYDKSAKELSGREDRLSAQDDAALKKYIEVMTGLDQKISEASHKMTREHQIVYNRFVQPEALGRIMEVIPREAKVILDLGGKDGIRQNMKFKVFGIKPGGDQVDKGFLIIKDIRDTFSLATLLNEGRKVEAVVAGDHVGSPAFTPSGRNFYLAGRFDTRESSKYSKDDLIKYLQYMGNRVQETLDGRVDMVVEGGLAERDVATAAALGISIISEEQMIPYLGD